MSSEVTNESIDELEGNVEPVEAAILDHEIYNEIRDRMKTKDHFILRNFEDSTDAENNDDRKINKSVEDSLLNTPFNIVDREIMNMGENY